MLRIDRVVLRNFGSILYEDVSLDAPITAFAGTGDNGDGKSTVFKGVELNLFDTFKGTIKDYIRWGEKSFDNEVYFTWNGLKGLSKVHGTKSKNDRYLELGDEVITESSEVLKKLKSLWDPKMFEASSIMREGQADVVTTSPAQRRDLLKGVYDLNFDEEVVELEHELEEHKERLSNVETQISALELKEYPTPSIPVCPQELVGKTVEEMEQQKIGHQHVLDNYDLAMSSYSQALSNLHSLDQMQKNAESNLSRTNVDIKNLHARRQTTLEDQSRVVDVEVELEPLKEQVEQKQALVQGMILPRVAPQMLQPCDRSEQTRVLQVTTYLEGKLSQMEEALASAQKGICPTCGQTLPEVDTAGLKKEYQDTAQNLSEAENALREVSKEIADYDEEVQKRQAEIQAYNDQVNAYNRANNELEIARNNLSFQRDALTAQQSQRREHLQNTLDQIDSDLTLRHKEVESLQQEVKNAQQAFTTAQSSLPPKPEVDETAQQNALQMVQILNDQISSLQRYHSQVESVRQIQDQNEQLKQKDAELLDSHKRTRDDVQAQVNGYEEAIKTLKTHLPQYILHRLTKQLEDIASDMLDATYGHQRIKFKPTKASLKLVYGEQDQDVQLASGFEKAIFSLAFKVALSLSQGTGGILILDEFDAPASSENSKKTYRYIVEQLMAQGFVSQVLCITHKTETLDMLENEYKSKIYRFEKGVIVG